MIDRAAARKLYRQMDIQIAASDLKGWVSPEVEYCTTAVRQALWMIANNTDDKRGLLRRFLTEDMAKLAKARAAAGLPPVEGA